MRSPSLAFVLALTVPLGAQSPAPASARAATADLTFPEFWNGDGRQQLKEFFGQPLLLVTFFNGFGGTAASLPALELHERHASDGLVVVLAHGGAIMREQPDPASPAWAMRVHPGANVRLCASPKHGPSEWIGAMPPYWAVYGPDGCLVRAGNVEKNAKAMAEAVQTALRQSDDGWGEGDQVSVRACYARGELGKARAKSAACGLTAEVDRLFERRCNAVRWLCTDGQWTAAKREADRLAAAASGVAEWDAAVAALLAEFAGETGKRELELGKKLDRLLAPLAKSRGDEQIARRLREFAKKNEGSSAASRAGRVAEVVEQALTIR